MKRLLAICIAVLSISGWAQQSTVGNAVQQALQDYKYLQVVPISLAMGKPAGFGFKASNDGTNFVTITFDTGYRETAGQKSIFAPAIAKVGTNWVVTYDPQAGTAASAYGVAWSPDLVTWTRVGLVTNCCMIYPGNGFGQQFFTDSDGTVYLIQPYTTSNGGTEDIVYVAAQTNTAAYGAGNWATNPVPVVTNATDMCIIKEAGLYYAFISNDGGGGYAICSLTNSTGPQTKFILAKTNLFSTYTLESPQVIKLGPNNFIMYVVQNPPGLKGGIQKTLYSKSTDLYTWTTPQEINENGSLPGRGIIYPLTVPLDYQQVKSIANSNTALAQPDERVYYLTTTSATSVTNVGRPIGGVAAGLIKWVITAIGVNTGDSTTDVAMFEIWQGLAQDGQIVGPVYPMGEAVYKNIQRPNSTWNAQVVFADNDGAFNVPGYDTGPYLKVTGPSTHTVRWKVRETVDAVNAVAQGVAGPSTVNYLGTTNYEKGITAYAAGTPYTLTGTSALVDFGTTDPSVTLPGTGTFLLQANAHVMFVGTTYAATNGAAFKLRKTSGSAADVTSATRTLVIPIITTVTGDGGTATMPPVLYTGTAGDVIQLWGSVRTLPGVGTVVVDQAEVIATRIY